MSLSEFIRWHHSELGKLVKRGMQHKAERGGLPGCAPLGYLNKRDKSATTVEVDPAVAPLVKEAFELAAQGTLSLRAILHILTKKGLRSRSGKLLAVSGLWYLLRNPFYAGQIRRLDKVYPGNHQPLVDKPLFETVQGNLMVYKR